MTSGRFSCSQLSIFHQSLYSNRSLSMLAKVKPGCSFGQLRRPHRYLPLALGENRLNLNKLHMKHFQFQCSSAAGGEKKFQIQITFVLLDLPSPGEVGPGLFRLAHAGRVYRIGPNVCHFGSVHNGNGWK